MFKFIKLWKDWKGANEYWNNRYKSGLDSGSGSYGQYADFKIKVVNDFIQEKKIESLFDYGCGDGNNMLKLNFIHKYVGYDISFSAVEICKLKFNNSWMSFTNNINEVEPCDASLSMDVIFHLVDNEDFKHYMDYLFMKSKQYVIIFSTDYNRPFIYSPHYRDRCFSDYVYKNFPEWRIYKVIDAPEYFPNKEKFIIYKKNEMSIM